jgi:hypothetical protein
MSEMPHLPYADADGWWPEYAADEILPGLFQGGTEDHDVIGRRTPDSHYDRTQRFDVIVTLYADAQPAPWGVEEIRYGFGDAELNPTAIRKALALATLAHARWQAGERVLIRCQAGVNRSGLVTALVLMLDGYTPHDAIALIRERRAPAVLSNGHFVRWLVTEAPDHIARIAGKASPSTNPSTDPSRDSRAA